MDISLWCIFIIVVIPYVLVLASRLPSFSLEVNLHPRLSANELRGVTQRLYWAHLNSLEAIAPFAAAVFTAHMMHVDTSTIDQLAVTFVIFRIAHAMMYMMNQGVLRSLTFFISSACIFSLFILSAL